MSSADSQAPQPETAGEIEEEWCQHMSLAQKKAARKARARVVKESAVQVEEPAEQAVLPMINLQHADRQECRPILAVESTEQGTNESSTATPQQSDMETVCSFMQLSPTIDASSPLPSGVAQAGAVSVKNTFIDVLEAPPAIVLRRCNSSPAALWPRPEESVDECSAQAGQLDMCTTRDAQQDAELPDTPRSTPNVLDDADDAVIDEHTVHDGKWAKAAAIEQRMRPPENVQFPRRGSQEDKKHRRN
eukprot:6461544-Amphidinium_carterae.1